MTYGRNNVKTFCDWWAGRELEAGLKGNARRPLLLASLMLARHSASRRGASGVDPLSSGRPWVVQAARLVILTTENTGGTTELHGAVAARFRR
jgi:hypothetical protein